MAQNFRLDGILMEDPLSTYEVSEGNSDETPNFVQISGLVGHMAMAMELKFSCSGKLIASAGIDSIIMVWDVDISNWRLRLIGHTQAIMNLSWSKDDTLLVSASLDTTLRIWDVLSGKSLRVLKGHRDGVFSCKFNPSSYLIVSGSRTGEIKVWDVKTGNLIKTLRNEPYSGMINTLYFDNDGEILLTATFIGYCSLWNIAEEERIGQVLDTSVEKIEILKHNLIAIASRGRLLGYWDLIHGTINTEPIVSYYLNNEYITTVFKLDDLWIVSKCLSRQGLNIWSLKSQRILQQFKCHNENINCVAYHPATNAIATVAFGGDHTIKVWKNSIG